MEDGFKLHDVIRTPLVDELYKEDHVFMAEHVSVSNTESEREEQKARAEVLEESLEDFREIQQDLINYFIRNPKKAWGIIFQGNKNA